MIKMVWFWQFWAQIKVLVTGTNGTLSKPGNKQGGNHRSSTTWYTVKPMYRDHLQEIRSID